MIRIILLALFWIFAGISLPAQPVLFPRSDTDITLVSRYKSDNDIGPAIIDGILYYSTLTEETGPDKGENKFYDLVSVPMHKAQQKLSKRISEVQLNTPFHDGPVAWCDATGELFVTRSNMENASNKKNKSKNKKVPLKIVVYQKEANGWVFKEEFPYNTIYGVGHPAISKTGDTLVFVSNQPGGYGKSDLYWCFRDAGVWQKPQNMGPTVNTKKSEITPFISNDGTLFFASNGRKGYGGFDIYRTPLATSHKTLPVNLKRPVNSRANDMGFTLHYNQKIGYLVSNRKRGKNNDAIYCLKTKNFNFNQLPIELSTQQIDLKVEKSRLLLDQYAEEKKKENLLAQNVKYNISYELLDTSVNTDLKLSCWYVITTDTLKFGFNSYPWTSYSIDGSNAVVYLLEKLKQCMNEEFGEYITPGKSIDLILTGEADVSSISDTLFYNGEFGPVVQGTCISDGKRQTLKITSQTVITDRVLALLRAYGIKEFIANNIDAFRKTDNSFTYQLIPRNQLASSHEWAKIEVIVHNIFCNY